MNRICATCKHVRNTDNTPGFWRCAKHENVILDPLTGEMTVLYKYPYYCETSRRRSEKDNWFARWLFKRNGCCMPDGRWWEPKP